MNPFFSAKRFSLSFAFAGEQAKMGVQRLYPGAIDGDLDPQRAARFKVRPIKESGELPGADEAQGVLAENRVPVLFLGQPDRRMKMVVHVELVGDHLGLIDGIRSGSSDIDFLKRHDVGGEIADDSGNAARRYLAIHPHAAMNVICHDANHRTAGDDIRRRVFLRPFFIATQVSQGEVAKFLGSQEISAVCGHW